jgi:hypothetical protein
MANGTSGGAFAAWDWAQVTLEDDVQVRDNVATVYGGGAAYSVNFAKVGGGVGGWGAGPSGSGNSTMAAA